MSDQVLYSSHPVMFKNSPLGFVLAVLLIPAFGLGLIILLIWYLKCKAALLEVKNGEILYETGLLSKERTEVSVASVRTVKIKQSFMNRLFGVGTIEIFTAGDTPEFTARGLPDPHKLRDIIN